MTSINEAQYSAACAAASKVFDGLLTPSQGRDELAGEYGLNPNSALDFIRAYDALLRGKVLKRTMSAPAFRHFMSQIFDVRLEEQRRTAVAALRQHVEYYERTSRSRSVSHSKREVINEFEARLAAPATEQELEADFALNVERSMRLPGAERAARLAQASKVPRKLAVMTTVFVRNPDVVAEALSRANGVCEDCRASAPFLRAKDGSPYLEVHHRIQLASGGQDAVENAIALCPNCHRRRHFGEPGIVGAPGSPASILRERLP